ncbi:50S ribosomal protein L9 [bacterium]|nr:50S ribosomal protein L9 [bacterium]
MKIIMKKDLEGVGKIGEIVEVKDGYARNYLIPRQVAMRANPQNLKIFEQEKLRIELKENKEQRVAEQVAKKLSGVSLTATVAVGEEDKVFGAVTSQDIAELLKNQGFDIDRRKIQLEEPFKALGIYEVPIKLHTNVEAKVKLWVVKE